MANALRSVCIRDVVRSFYACVWLGYAVWFSAVWFSAVFCARPFRDLCPFYAAPHACTHFSVRILLPAAYTSNTSTVVDGDDDVQNVRVRSFSLRYRARTCIFLGWRRRRQRRRRRRQRSPRVCREQNIALTTLYEYAKANVQDHARNTLHVHLKLDV